MSEKRSEVMARAEEPPPGEPLGDPIEEAANLAMDYGRESSGHQRTAFYELSGKIRALRSSSPSAPAETPGEPAEKLVGGEGPAVPASQWYAALEAAGCIQIPDPEIADYRIYDVTTLDGIQGAVQHLVKLAALQSALQAVPPSVANAERGKDR